MDMSFDEFVQTIENVPPELERNFTLIRELDERTQEVMGRIEECILQYEATRSSSDRKKIRSETNGLFDKIDSYADDKVQLSLQTYELIDKNIKKLVSYGNTPAETTEEEPQARVAPPLGMDMPCDPNEPTYCYCKSVSYGEMIACENKECDIEWFHFGCVGITVAPKAKWYCGHCLPQMKAQYRKSISKRRRR